jgi:hypothetical protein
VAVLILKSLPEEFLMHLSTGRARHVSRCLLTVGVLALGACGGKGGDDAKRTPGVSGDTIYVGALTPLSDAVAVIGKPLLGGLTAFLEMIISVLFWIVVF